MTVSSNNAKEGDFHPFFFLHVRDDSFTVSSIKVTLLWILQVSDPHKEIRGIKEKIVFYQTGNHKKSLWPPVMLNKAPSACTTLGLDTCVLMETYLALFGEGNVISIVLLKNVQKAHFKFFFSHFIIKSFFYIIFWAFSVNRKQNKRQQAWLVPF